ncbi:hypothetical protein BCR35DRAFT_267003 [Leucosporidium creatinivorum]|uniref:NAD-dependent epimerase/dehydratase domain-containing protein n=1 Tax=Leucosporidium creatinivorum TaxID=106004 RepID=A0A1Y2F3H7_9BASI|nr:hypothetical protein BCR35DRAFT_267003 [Leucosporidium creatinivorum]
MRFSCVLLQERLALVTGANGYLGSATVHAFLQNGFRRVRGTVRSQAKADAWERRHGSLKGKIDWSIVEDMTAPSAFAQAVTDVSVVAHVASPVNYSLKDKENNVLKPAIIGVLRLLEDSAGEESVERVVFTSSAATIIGAHSVPGVGKTYTDDDWQPATYEQAMNSKSGVFVYEASKKFAELAAWRFMKERKPMFALTTLAPPMVYGPPMQPIESLDALNVSVRDLWALVDAKQLPLATMYPICADVRDIAELHVRAATTEAAKGQRYLCVAHHYTYRQMGEAIRSDPALTDAQRARIPSRPVEKDRPHFATDSSKVERDLGIKWRPFEETVRDTARELFRIEAELKGRQ